jgi:hypothetical protein
MVCARTTILGEPSFYSSVLLARAGVPLMRVLRFQHVVSIEQWRSRLCLRFGGARSRLTDAANRFPTFPILP